MKLSDYILKNRSIFATDKLDLGYVDEFYNDIFSQRKDKIKNLLEIGIQNGFSINLWKNYLPNANIHCVDITPISNSSLSGSNVFPYFGNAYSKEYLNKFENEFFDVIIDDGPHTLESQIYFLENFTKKLKSKGILILEDIIDMNGVDSLMNCLNKDEGKITLYDMRGKQKNSNLNQRWLKGLNVITFEKY